MNWPPFSSNINKKVFAQTGWRKKVSRRENVLIKANPPFIVLIHLTPHPTGNVSFVHCTPLHSASPLPLPVKHPAAQVFFVSLPLSKN